MTIRLRPCFQGGFSLIELTIGLGILAIAGGMVAMTLAVTTTAIRDTQSQALLAQKWQRAAKLLDADIKQASFLLSAKNGDIRPLWNDPAMPVASVTILDQGRRLRCIRLGEEFDGRIYRGITPAGNVNHETTEMLVVGNAMELASRIGPDRAFICVEPNGGGRFGRLFVTSAAPNPEPAPNERTRARVRGTFVTSPCLTVGDCTVPPPNYGTGDELSGMLFVPVSSLVEYRIEDEGLVRYEFAGNLNPCSGVTQVQRTLLIDHALFSDITFDYLLKTGGRTETLTAATLPQLRGILLETKRRTVNRAEVTERATFVVNEGW